MSKELEEFRRRNPPIKTDGSLTYDGLPSPSLSEAETKERDRLKAEITKAAQAKLKTFISENQGD